MSTGEATMAIVLIVAIALPALAFWRLGTKFEVDNSPPLKAIALGIGFAHGSVNDIISAMRPSG
jgi:hypothetical protein